MPKLTLELLVESLPLSREPEARRALDSALDVEVQWTERLMRKAAGEVKDPLARELLLAGLSGQEAQLLRFYLAEVLLHEAGDVKEPRV